MLLQFTWAQSQLNSSGSEGLSLVNQYRIVSELSGTALALVLTIWESAYSGVSGFSLSCERSEPSTPVCAAGTTAAWAAADTSIAGSASLIASSSPVLPPAMH